MADSASPEHVSLANTSVLVTRPSHQADRLAYLIEKAGGEAVRFPALKIVDPENRGRLFDIVDHLDRYHMAIFISPNAVSKAMALINARRDGLPPALQIASVGRGSARELERFGIGTVIAADEKFDSESLLALAELNAIQGKNIVIFRGDGGRELLGNTLIERGAHIDYAECYRRKRPTGDTAALVRRWGHDGIDIVTITSAEGLRNLYDMMGKQGRPWLIKTPIVVVSARQAAVCRELGFKHQAWVANAASDEAILEAVKTWRASQ